MAMDVDWRIIWLAGFFDGEGCIYFQKKDANAYPGLDLTGTCFVAASRILEVLKMLDIKPVVNVQSAKPPRAKYMSIKVCNREDIIKLLSAIEPFLVTKRLRAVMMLAFFEKHRARKPLTVECKNIVNEVTAMNSMQGGRKKWLWIEKT